MDSVVGRQDWATKARGQKFMCKTIDLCIRKWVNQLIANEPTCQQHIRVIIHATKTMKLQSKIQVKAVKVADFAKKSNNSAASCKLTESLFETGGNNPTK